jgi:hypothetical protein
MLDRAEDVLHGTSADIGNALEATHEPRGPIRITFGEGLGEVGKGLGDALKIAVGVLSVGAVVIGGIWILRR